MKHLSYKDFKAQFGDLGLTKWVKYNWLGEVPGPGPEPGFPVKTVSEMIAMAVPGSQYVVYDRTTLYIVSGIIEQMRKDVWGNAYLRDPSTGESIQLYGSTTTDSALSIDESKGGWDFKNPRDALKTLAHVNDGDQVTVKALFEDYKGTPEIMGVIIEHTPAN